MTVQSLGSKVIAHIHSDATHTLYTDTLHTHTHTYSPHTPHTLHRVMVMNEISLMITECLLWICTTSGFTLTTEKLKVKGSGRREDVVVDDGGGVFGGVWRRVGG